MTSTDGRIERWLADLVRTLDTAATLAERGETAYRTDAALPLAFEALSNRIGDLAKKLVTADPIRFADPVWPQAARNRDFIVHHYHRRDDDLFWATVTVEFPRLAGVAGALQRTPK